MPWSDQSYGPDGPWHAVSVELGSNKQPINLYPGDRWASTILIDTVCSDDTTTCYARRAGLFNIDASTSAVTLNTQTDPTQMNWLSDQSSAGVNKWGGTGYVKEGVLADTLTLQNGHKVPNVSMASIYDAYQEYPNGKRYPVSVGVLSLGAPKASHVVDGNKFNLLSAWEHWNDSSSDRIPSYSWGMHIGSVEPEIPGSLMLGGYDQNRVLDQVSSQQVDNTRHLGNLRIYLKDIGIGVATGDSPFGFENKSGLFTWENSTIIRGKQVEIDPTLPYLYLPKDACDTMTADLPVTFNEDLGLYFWNTDDESYEKITSSPAYMSFTFEKNAGNTQNITIKVPFQLLKLTLQKPLVEQNTTYFPCYPSDSFVLGRAFLQAAFIGTNWQEGIGSGYWFLAQAPGPAIGSSAQQSIEISDTSITASANSWEDSWNGYWVPLSSKSSNPGLSTGAKDGTGNSNSSLSTEAKADTSNSSPGLSTGAKVGIGIGCAAGGLVLIVILWVIISHRKRTTNSHPKTIDEYIATPSSAEQDKPPQMTELYGHYLSELRSDKKIQEVPGSTARHHELP
ncbi:uncharacterized protein N7479_006389 [Penicillium vulpinum]|uniref:Peptidase A1 domain-containing protein n=1 Tax=Penicillium vulpinum TaxID=29845 RepID=A0A1V6S1K0_9EURO|nr:uncharacterized protein N7479_006389 [Penicillium vulpinum]KAJ5959239.1 hypothetical protein N7479_006389 [Penicillium vulpinum]OQE07921.1 hypothetical protein PENVUL_c011G00162 [Penicillium vulpinum]